MLNLEQASAVALLLATIDENLTLTSIRVPKAHNAKVYFINSKDGELSISINSFELEKLGNNLGKILDYIIKSNNFILPARENIFDVLADIFNSYKSSFEEKYKESYPENSDLELEGETYSLSAKFIKALEVFKDESNKTNNEDKIFDLAIGQCLSIFNNKEPLNGEDTKDDFYTAEKVHDQDLEILRSEHNTDWIYFDKVPPAKMEKIDLERIKLMIVATISPDTQLEITGYDNLENITNCLFYGIEDDDKPYEVFLHDRSCHIAETEILKNKLYSAITNAFDLEKPEDCKEHEKMVFDILKEDIQRFGDSYFFDKNLKGLSDTIENTYESNAGRETRLMKTYTLTLATLFMELKDHIAKISKEDFSAEHLENVIKQNFELVKRDDRVFSNFAKLVANIIRYRNIIRVHLENGEVVNKKELEKLESTNIALKNALIDLVGIDSLPGNFDDLITINEDTLTDEMTDDEDYDEDHDDFDDELFDDEYGDELFDDE